MIHPGPMICADFSLPRRDAFASTENFFHCKRVAGTADSGLVDSSCLDEFGLSVNISKAWLAGRSSFWFSQDGRQILDK